MKTTMYNLKGLLNTSKYQKIQDDIALATGLALIAVDYKGVPVTTHSYCSGFCKRVRATAELRKYCETCDSHAALEATRTGKPYIYYCHAGIIDIAIPIIYNNMFLGAFMAGQVLLESQPAAGKQEPILPIINYASQLASQSDFQSLYEQLPKMTLEKINAVTQLLTDIGKLIINEAIAMETISDLRLKIGDLEAQPARTEARWTTQAAANSSLQKVDLIWPALDYIEKNPQARITLKEMAALCNISTSYFSKLFAKANLGNLSDYVNQVKIQSARKLLENTDQSIRSIASSLGFDDSGYFIKVFKRFSGVTPQEFRQKIHS